MAVRVCTDCYISLQTVTVASAPSLEENQGEVIGGEGDVAGGLDDPNSQGVGRGVEAVPRAASARARVDPDVGGVGKDGWGFVGDLEAAYCATDEDIVGDIVLEDVLKWDLVKVGKIGRLLGFNSVALHMLGFGEGGGLSPVSPVEYSHPIVWRAGGSFVFVISGRSFRGRKKVGESRGILEKRNGLGILTMPFHSPSLFVWKSRNGPNVKFRGNTMLSARYSTDSFGLLALREMARIKGDGTSMFCHVL